MKLKFITCSGANEHTDIERLVNLCTDYSLSEIGIQVSGRKASFSLPRYWWIKALQYYIEREPMNVRIALHLNEDWVESFCRGEIPPELGHFLKMKDYYGNPFVKRVQLNFKIGREKTPDVKTLLATMNEFPRHHFILSYNESNADIIQQIYQTGFKFDCLYDGSFGGGIMPDCRPAPVFKNILQGYAGGLSPENVTAELDKIGAVTPESFYIDAQGKLEDVDGHLSLEKCEAYLKEAYAWAYKGFRQ